MRVLIRSLVSGTEYWDTEEKRNVFVPAGQEPDFEVTAEPVSMIDHKSISVDQLEGEDSIVMEKQDDDSLKVTDEEIISVDDEPITLEEMTAKQLLEYAKRKDIEIPRAVRIKGDILNIILDSE